MDHDEDNPQTNPVLDYYNKYSRNKNLTKYFRGTDQLTEDVYVKHKNNYFTGSNDSLKDTKHNNVLLNTTKTDDDCIDVDIHIELDQEDSYAKNCNAGAQTETDAIIRLSPTSSVTSNRKLEWDNGADIGYENINEKNLHKSLSLPTLNTLEKVVSEQVIRHSPDGKPAESSQNNTNMCNLRDTTSESSLECDIDKKNLSTTTSSYRKSPSFGMTSSSSRVYETESPYSNTEQGELLAITLQQEKPQPLAESTPQNNPKESSVTSRRNSKSSKQSKSCSKKKSTTTSSDTDVDKTKLKQKSMPLSKHAGKDLKLCLSKPIVVECIAEIESRNKLIQTTLPHNASACIQTDNITQDIKLVEKMDYKDPNYIERQNVIFVKHSDRVEEDAGEVTKSNSFEFIVGNQLDKIRNQSNEGTIKSLNSDEESIKKTVSPPMNNDIPKDSSNQNSSLDSPLSNLMLRKQSGNLIQDLEKSIELLQQVLKSQQHDETTKKKYIRKIAKKIIQNRYNDDSSISSINESVNNDHKRNKEILEHLQKNVPWKPIEIVNFKSKEPEEKPPNGLINSSNQSTGHKKQQKQQEIPSTSSNEVQQTVDRVKSAEERQKKNPPKLDVVSTSIEIKDIVTDEGDVEKSKEELIKPTYEKVNKPRHSLFTITSSQLAEPTKLSSDNTINSERSTINEMHVSSAYSSLKKTSNSSDNNTDARRSWRDDKTLSEKLLEEKITKCNEVCGDNKEAALNFNKFKKENQLNWINNEINHLHNLRKILECNQEEIRKALIDKPYEELQPNPKPTSVYVLTTQQPSANSRFPKTSNKATQYGTEIDMKIGLTNYTLKTNPCCKCKKHFCNCPKVDKDLLDTNKPKASPLEKYNLPPTSNKAETDVSESGSKKFCKICKGICVRPSCSMYKPKSSGSSLGEVDGNKKLKPDASKRANYEIVKKPNEPLVIVLKINKDDNDDYAKSSTSSSTTSTVSEKTFCRCCKRCFTKTSSSMLTELLADVDNLCPRCCTTENNKNYACQQYPNCNCYTCVNMKTIDDIRNTVKDLDHLERQQSLCSCKYELSKNAKGCPLCSRRKKGKKGIAYTLNLVPENFKKTAKRKEKERKKSLESVTIKIPYQTLNTKTKCPPCDTEYDSDESKENKKEKRRKKSKKKRKSCTLQDYLAENRPDFVQAAEERRRCMMELAYLRSKRIEKYKRLLALTTNVPTEKPNYNNNKPKGLFTTKEMKSITAKKYKKLPEVQQKKELVKKQQIVTANRLITNIFNERLRRKVLKGQRDFSTSISVINI